MGAACSLGIIQEIGLISVVVVHFYDLDHVNEIDEIRVGQLILMHWNAKALRNFIGLRPD
jgi:hypothetical protein